MWDTNSNGPTLKYRGAVVIAGAYGGWKPIGAEKTADGYEVAWKNGAADQYSVWNADSSGNYVLSATALVSGSSAALESLELSFQQDLNGDGTVGIPTMTSSANGDGATVWGNATSTDAISASFTSLASYAASFAAQSIDEPAAHIASVQSVDDAFLTAPTS
jgi:hypothetical protein